MKKFITSFILFLSLFVFNCFSEQPFYLQNWIIPDDFVWGVNESLPSIPGKLFWQRMSTKYDDSYIEINRTRSGIDFPPYFVENNLISWEKTYEEIIDAFKGNELFFTYEYIYPIAHQDKPADGIEFLDIIKVVCRENNYYEVELYFPHVKTQEERNVQKISYCYFFYYRDGLDKKRLAKPQREIFEEKNQREWNKYSLEEKSIIVLSYLKLMDNGFYPLKFDCTLMNNNNNANPTEYLKTNFKVKNKEELLDYINTHMEKTIYPLYFQYLEEIDSNPEKEIIEIGAEKNYTVREISRMFFAQNMRNSLGNNGIYVFEYSTYLFMLRLGVGAGFLSREEAINFAMPLANNLLKQFSSFYDYAANFAACESYIGVTNSAFVAWPVNIMKYYNDAPKYMALEEISFDGSEADEPLSFYDAYYKTENDGIWWNKVQKEYEKHDGNELATVKFLLSLYGDVPCLEKLIKDIKPKKYDSTKNQDAGNFFNTNYKNIWNKLPENEKYAIAFSSNLFELNHQYHLDFDNKVQLSDDSSDSKELLKDSWGIESYEGLTQTFESLEEYGHSGAYKALSDLLNKYPDKSLFEIASLENLTMQEITRLHFVKETKDLLGEHGIEAWDEGREITIMRWGIASGYISSSEAMELIEPVIKRIRQNYSSFEDFISHYIMGRQFYALYDGTYEKLGEKARGAAFSARAYIPFDSLKFTPEENTAAKVMTYSDCLYSPSQDFLKWERVMELYRQNATEETIEQLKKIEEEMPEIRNVVFYWHMYLLNYYQRYDELIQFAEENWKCLENLPKDSEGYVNSLYYYIASLNDCFNPEKALSVYSSLPDQLQGNIYFYYQYAYANYLMINKSRTQEELNMYRSKAAAALKTIKEYNFNIGDRLEGWLESNSR